MWKDFDLYVFIQECNKDGQNFTGCFSKEDVSIKYLMLPPNMHYLELPLAEWLEHKFKLSNIMTPNFVSFSGVAVGFSAAFLISQGHRWSILAGVIVYKLRDIADGLDGILARSLVKVKLSNPGISGYYIDGLCDVFSETALIYSIALLINRTEKSKIVMEDRKISQMMKLMSKSFAPMSFSVLFLGVQSIVSAVGWNWTTDQLHLHANIHQLASLPCLMVIFFWRILNPHMLTQFLLVSLVMDKCQIWVEMTRYIVTIPLCLLCACSYLLIYKLKQG